MITYYMVAKDHIATHTIFFYNDFSSFNGITVLSNLTLLINQNCSSIAQASALFKLMS